MSYNDWAWGPPFVYPIIIEHDEIFQAFPLHLARDQKVGLGKARECDCVTSTRGSHFHLETLATGITIESNDQSHFWEPITGSK